MRPQLKLLGFFHKYIIALRNVRSVKKPSIRVRTVVQHYHARAKGIPNAMMAWILTRNAQDTYYKKSNIIG